MTPRSSSITSAAMTAVTITASTIDPRMSRASVAPAAQRGDEEERDRVHERCPEGDPPQRIEQTRQRAEQFGELVLEGVGHLGEGNADRHRDHADDRQGDVGRSSGPPFVLGRGVQLHSSAEQTPR